MCISVPGRIISIKDCQTAEVDFNGISRIVSIELCPEVEVGDFVLIHVGFAIQKIEEEEAKEIMDIFEELEEKRRFE